MYHTSKKDSLSLKSLMGAILWHAIENRGHSRFVARQKHVAVIFKTEKSGGHLANSENQTLLSLKILHIPPGLPQEASENATENSRKYKHLAQQFFQKDFLLAGNLPANKGYVFG